jgi:hypothetical protein
MQRSFPSEFNLLVVRVCMAAKQVITQIQFHPNSEMGGDTRCAVSVPPSAPQSVFERVGLITDKA